MSPLIRPVYNLMNRLSYRSKFLLMASLLAVPLILLSTKLALNFHAEVNQAQEIRLKLIDIRRATQLVEQLELLRDNSVVHFLTKNETFTLRFNEAQQKVRGIIDELIASSLPEKHGYFLSQLSDEIESKSIFPGNEGATVSVVFDNANAFVEQAYLWRMKLAYDYVSESNPDVRAILEMISDNYYYFLALGKARALGTYHLERGYLDSFGIQMLDSTYQELTSLIQNLDVGEQQYFVLKARYPNLNSRIKVSQMEFVRALLDEQLIQPIELNYSAQSYYQLVSGAIEVLQEENDAYLNLTQRLLQEREDYNTRQLVEFYSYAAVVTCILIYLVLGFYSYIKIAIRSLVMSAQRVARGQYNKEIKFEAKDELLELAQAMDEMRLKLKVREEQLKLMSQTDGLTQLKNRAFFDEAYPLALANASRNSLPVCLIMMDLDHFKSVNDEHGHQVGDDCLREVSALFRKQFKRKTDIVARYGGEEFIAVIVGESAESVFDQTEALREQIARHAVQSDGVILNLSASFGLAHCIPSDAVDQDQLLSYCDSLLYEAKRSGRNKVVSSDYNLREAS